MVIGLSGKIGTGKTAVAKILAEHGYVRRSFADALREEIAEALDIPVEWTHERKAETLRRDPSGILPRRGMTIREAIQWWGTDFRKAQDPLYWIAQVDAWIAAHPGVDVVVDDVRFPDEVDMLLARGAITVRLLPYDGWQPGPHANHASETALDGYPKFHLVRRPVFGELDAVADEVMAVARLRSRMLEGC